MRTDKELRIQHILKANPGLVIEYTFIGSILAIENEIAYVEMKDEHDDEEYDAEMKVSLFPQDGFALGNVFWLCVGYVQLEDGSYKSFQHINYFYWTAEQIERIEKDAKLLAERLHTKLNVE